MAAHTKDQALDLVAAIFVRAGDRLHHRPNVVHHPVRDEHMRPSDRRAA